jgi:hypothetical protein
VTLFSTRSAPGRSSWAPNATPDSGDSRPSRRRLRTRSSWRCTVTTSSTSAPESTRPGAAPVAEAEELARIEPVLADLARALDVPVSVDTYKSTVAARAVELGAVMVNDVWGLQKDPGMADAVAAAEAAVVIMHNLVERVRQSTSWISGNSLHVHSRSQRRPAMRHHASSLISASHLPKAHARTPK